MIAEFDVFDPDNNRQHAQLKRLFADYQNAAKVRFDDHLIERLGALPYCTIMLAYHNSKAVGFAVCYESFSSYRCQPMLNIHDFMICKQARGRGIGRQLIQHILLWAKQQGMLKVTLEVDSDNLAAQALYRQQGFESTEVKLPGMLHWQKYL